MSTNRARSFGLAIIVAIGVIAAMAAMGLFSTGPAHAQTDIDVIFTPSSLAVGDTAEWIVEFPVVAGDGIARSAAIMITFPHGVTFRNNADTGETADYDIVVGDITVEAAGKTYSPTSDASVNEGTETVTLTLLPAPADAPDLYPIDAGAKVTVTFLKSAGIMNPRPVSGTEFVTQPEGAQVEVAGDPEEQTYCGAVAGDCTFYTRTVFTPSSLDVNAVAAWKVDFVTTEPIAPGTGEVKVVFPAGVTLPVSIDKARITMGTGTFVYPLTVDPIVNTSDGSVVLVAPATTSSGGPISATVDPVPGNRVGAHAFVVVNFSQVIGIKNPATGDAAGALVDGTAGRVDDIDITDCGEAQGACVFDKTISLDKSAAPEGSTVMVTLGGFTGGLRITLSGAVTGTSTVKDDGTAVVSGTMGDGTVKTVMAKDGAGLEAESGEITVTPTLTATATGKAQDVITLTGTNFSQPVAAVEADADAKPTVLAKDAMTHNIPVGSIVFGGDDLTTANEVTDLSTAYTLTDEDNDGAKDDFSIQIKIPSNAPSGVNQVKVTDSEGKSATATVDVTAPSVTLSPTSGAPGSVVTVSGSNFPAGRPRDGLNNVITIAPAYGSLAKGNLSTNSGGNLTGSNTFKVPTTAAEGGLNFTVTILGEDEKKATGSATFTVQSRGLAVTPSSGPKGTRITVSGSNFHPGGVIATNGITVDGEATIHEAIGLDSSGRIPPSTVSVPNADSVSIGEVTVKLTVTKGAEDPELTGTGTFTVTQPTISIEPTTSTVGNPVVITGEGWVPNSIVTLNITDQVDVEQVLAAEIAVATNDGSFEKSMVIPSTVGVEAKTVPITAQDVSHGNKAQPKSLTIAGPSITLSPADVANVGSRVDVMATGFNPNSGLSVLTIGGANVRESVEVTNDQGKLTTSFLVPGLVGSQLVVVEIGGTEVSTSITVERSAAVVSTDPRVIFADEIASGNLVRIFYFDNGTKQFSFFDPAFDDDANTLNSIVKGQIVDIGVNADTTFQGVDLTPVYNRIALP